MDSLDDAFAAFLSELPDEPSETPPKRARTSGADDAEVLRKAAYNGDASEVERILGALSPVDRLLIIDSGDDDDGFAALHLAAMRGHLAVVQALLQRRADVDVASSTGNVCHSLACYSLSFSFRSAVLLLFPHCVVRTLTRPRLPASDDHDPSHNQATTCVDSSSFCRSANQRIMESCESGQFNAMQVHTAPCNDMNLCAATLHMKFVCTCNGSAQYEWCMCSVLLRSVVMCVSTGVVVQRRRK